MIFIEAFLIRKNMENVEVWKDIVGFEGYQVSNLGRVKSLNRVVFRKNRMYPIKERILKHGVCGTYYFYVALFSNKKQYSRMIHQLVAMAFLDHIPCGFKFVVNHINFDKKDNRVENLEIITNRENCNKKHFKSVSQYTGVHFDKKNKKWQARISINNKRKYLGLFINEIDAHKAYENELKKTNIS